MSIALKALYRETAPRYGLKLLAGEAGLAREATWVQFCEEPDNIEFFRGGELVLTTGLCLGRDLLSFLQRVLKKRAAGVVFNIGKYISPEDVTDEVKAFCERESLPIFSMPWHVRMGDIMEDYCDRLLTAKQDERGLCDLLQTAIFQPGGVAAARGELKKRGLYHLPFVFCAWQEMRPPKDPKRREMLLAAKSYLNRRQGEYVIFWQRDRLVALIFEPQERAEKILTGVSQAGRAAGLDLFGGAGEIHKKAKEISLAFNEACAALIMARARKKAALLFGGLGIYRLLFAVQDKTLLKKMADEELGALKGYDSTHGGALLSTLRAYLFCGGSLQAAAEATFTHRNTVSYRLTKIKEIVGEDLDTAEKRFSLMLAFYIEEMP